MQEPGHDGLDLVALAADPANVRLAYLFGISDPTAIRYCAELDQIITASASTPAIA